jgi:AraC-like DNA-binding protein
MEIIAWVGFSQGMFAALLISAKRENSLSDKILSGWLVLIAFEFLTCALDYRIFGKPLLSSSFLLFNPAFYLYVDSLTNKNFRLRWIQLLHLVPFFAFEISAYIIKETISFNTFFRADTTLGFRITFGVVNILSWVVYNIIAGIRVVKHRKNLENEFSSIEKNVRIGWLIFVIVFYNAYCLGAYIIGITEVFHSTDILVTYIYNYAAMLFLVYALGFYGLGQKSIYLPVAAEDIPVKYKSSVLSAHKKKEIKERILHYFENEKPYLNPDLNMDMLSSALSVPKHQLTEVLNTVIGKNFFKFVNSYRIEAVKKMLADGKNKYSIEAIGYECGFSSKSSFFTVFKNFTGQTPTEYRNSL